jgi:hypothetical protein
MAWASVTQEITVEGFHPSAALVGIFDSFEGQRGHVEDGAEDAVPDFLFAPAAAFVLEVLDDVAQRLQRMSVFCFIRRFSYKMKTEEGRGEGVDVISTG